MIEAKAVGFLNSAAEKNYLRFDDARQTYHILYGLIVRDAHVRLLLGERRELVMKNFERDAQTAIAQFYQLYGVEE